MRYEENIKLLKKSPNIFREVIQTKPLNSIYEVVDTKVGVPTVKINLENKRIYLHSKYDPYREAEKFAEENLDSSVENYIVIGMGFAYHIENLIEKAPNANFYILETNKNIFRLALDYIDLNNILNNNRVKVHLSDSALEISDILRDLLFTPKSKLIIHNPSINIMSEELRDIKYLLEEFKMLSSSVESHSLIMQENFDSNINQRSKNVDVLFNKFKDKPLYIISAGPSLDKNIKELSKIKDKGIIMVVGRAVKSLIKEGITPDIIIITDPSPHLYNNQLKDIDINVPIIVLSTCDKNVMLNYKGDKLIALQKGYLPAEEYAKTNNNILVKTGGSVATTALDVGIRMRCNPITFVGQDLAFTDSKTHSVNTNSRDVIQSKNLREVEDVNGNRIYTSKNLFIYLRWIQNRINQENDILFIDATEGGAKIKGTKILTLRNTIEKYSRKSFGKNL
ncbi:DUF115 domain-containing protein [Serpentinicella sp. ANB-PHB4]|uniref:motility associated factor glycosyltransferase family protein n=1 Tax=Serpentinicella sp. ANB-PHB4 TaxID=3074076 RepID=UPI00285EE29B|nr:6-hydroxymethylpterin diphosphokinase MptE-like protein [Serpentinicella sp. ANB-PHB4]MDR5659776.1 DUF115 domain-containing protein [Serpentinicella sp. ANB-PHB4]